jgi:pentatricopeptide repeat-containing protein PET309
MNTKGRHFQQAWDLYSGMNNDQRRAVRGPLVSYLSHSHSIVETGRALSLFRQIPPTEWNNQLLSSGILLILRSGDLPAAVEAFKTGLENGGLSHGLEFLMADTINSKKWSIALDVWTSYYKSEVSRNPRARPNLERLQQLGTLAKKGDLYFAFRAYLVGEGRDQYKEIQKDMVAKRALSALRRFFATLALREPCRPAQASVILETLGDNYEYNTYLNTMFNRWYDKLEDRYTMEQLPAIYQKQRKLPDASPAMPVYRGLFKVNFPKNKARLEELHHDWVRFKGGLNQWGYEKFLKYYASRGDVPSVKKLWAQFVKDYPELLREPRGFRSIVNVYAQVGDVEGVKKELERMVKEYNVQPDLDNWNMLLKAYMRTNDYDGVLDLFDQISSQHEPDSYTYAHVMAMSSKKGDLDTTLEYFTKSQQAGVPITKEMGLSLIVAYGRNGQLLEAETLCVEMTRRKIASQATWNQLLNFNGVEGKIDKVYELLRHMKESGVEWDDETYEFLLQALVRVNRIHPAYNLLKRAVDERLFLVTPEHYAIVMAAGARLGEAQLVENLFHQLQKSELPVTFSALVALVTSASNKRPGADRTRNLANEFVEYFRQAAEAAKLGKSPSDDFADANNVADLKLSTPEIGRAIALLVELREFGSIEELMGLFVQIFPQYRTQQQFPPEIMSALMHAHYVDQNYDKVLELWEKTWQDVYASSRKRSGDGIAGGTEYDLCRVVDVVVRAYTEKGDATGLSNTVDKVIAAGFKLTRQNWVVIIRDLCGLGKWERAMYWCEKLLMPAWEGWGFKRDIPAKRRNTRMLSPPPRLVLRLQQEWLEMRKMAAWSPDVSHVLSTVEEKYPRLHHAFTTSEVESMPTKYTVNGKEISAGELDGVLQSLPYQSLLKVKENLRRELEKEQKREVSLGIPKTTMDKAEWKEMLHDKVRRYAKTWYSARKKAHDEESRSMREILRASGFMGNISIKAKAMEQEGADHRAAREQFAYWNKFWDRYDQRRHGEVKKKPARPSGFHRKNPLEAGKIREWRNNRMGRGADDE